MGRRSSKRNVLPGSIRGRVSLFAGAYRAASIEASVPISGKGRASNKSQRERRELLPDIESR
jgi:hypothetical protein